MTHLAIAVLEDGFPLSRESDHWDSNYGNRDKRGKVCKILAYRIRGKESLASQGDCHLCRMTLPGAIC